MTDGDTTPAQQDPAQRVMIFDTTLRDGEQAPRIALNTREKVEIAQQLARLGVDVIEAGFPISSPGDFEATRAVAVETEGLIVAALSRANERDVTVAGEAVRDELLRLLVELALGARPHAPHALVDLQDELMGSPRLHRKKAEDGVRRRGHRRRGT